jgi:hypothetical protein
VEAQWKAFVGEGKDAAEFKNTTAPQWNSIASLPINAFLTLSALNSSGEKPPGSVTAEASLTRKIPWQPYKFHVEIGGCPVSRAGAAILLPGCSSVAGCFPGRKARASA